MDTKKLVTAYPKIAKVLRKNLMTSIPAAELSNWAELAGKVRTAKIQRVGLVDDAAAPDFTAIRQLVTRALQPSSSQSPGSAAEQKFQNVC